MACFDPPTKQVSIRGKTRVIGAEHVHQLMGLPFGGKGIEVKLSEQNPTYRDFRHAYKNIKYNTLGDTFSGKLDENFEYLFVLFTLGTLLAPSASILVSDRMLKVVTLTKDALGEFDWSSFILEELSQQIHKFNKHSHKSKATKRKTVGGCVYFLMPLNTSRPWLIGPTTGLRARAVMEKKSKTGLLARISRSQPSDTTSASFDPHTMLTHPEVRTTYFRLVSMECEEDDDDRDEEDDDKEIDDEGDEKEIEDEDDDNDKEKDDQDDEKEIEDEDDEKYKEDEDDHIVDIDDEDSHLHDTPIQGERSDGKIRRSKRVITRSSVLKSPWIDPNRKTKGKRLAPPEGRATLSETTYVDKQYGNDYDCQDIGC
ncbi:hypothetical protein K1719_008016 [Acacia pycnantha]|nr:hypothetical protein K1719_008016 [Acacia pycnantha]